MSIPSMQVDFVRVTARTDLAGRALLVAGMLALAIVVWSYRQLRAEAEGLELRAAAFSTSGPDVGAPTNSGSNAVASARHVVTELATPWSQLLEELDEAGAYDPQSVALLAIEPDVEHREVRIVAESRNLPAALAYTARLQQSAALHFPLLVSHEIQTKDEFQPVRFEIAAQWRVTP